jgi:general L-amino acid transport system permease protein
MAETERTTPFWLDPNKRAWVYQLAAAVLVAAVGYIIFSNTQANLARQSVATGFSFLKESCSFEIGESLISYSAASSYATALIVGILNTLKVAVVGTILAIILGTLVGIARLSSNWLVSKIAGAYIEVMQNIPALLQLFFWYAMFYQNLPSPRAALSPVEGVYLCNRGVLFPVPEAHPAYPYILAALAGACFGMVLLRRWAKNRQAATGKTFPVFKTSVGLIIGLPALVWLFFGAPMAMNVPELKGFNFKGGMSLSPEFTALLIGLVMYTGAFIAEVVRSGIASVDKGQTEAAKAIGLRGGRVLHLVVLPQALRVIVPPVTSQMLNLTKNSSLAVGIGYPDFFSVANTTINQTGQAIEGVLLILVVYLMFSLATSAFMNWYNRKTQLVER